MAGRKRKYTPKNFESRGEKYLDCNGKIRSDTSANIYESLLTSDAFKNLTSKQKILYVYAKAQFYGHRKPEKDFKDLPDVAGNECFYLQWKSVQDYGLYTSTSHSNFYADMKALIDHGFIERVASGKRQRQKTIYRFCSEWQKWKI